MKHSLYSKMIHACEQFRDDEPAYGHAQVVSGQALKSVYTRKQNPLGAGVAARIFPRAVVSAILSAVVVGLVVSSKSIAHWFNNHPRSLGSNALAHLFASTVLVQIELGIVVLFWVRLVPATLHLIFATRLERTGHKRVASLQQVYATDQASTFDAVDAALAKAWAEAMSAQVGRRSFSPSNLFIKQNRRLGQYGRYWGMNRNGTTLPPTWESSYQQRDFDD